MMEHVHRRRLAQHFRPHLKHARVTCLGVPDDFDYLRPELVELLRRKVSPFLLAPPRRAWARVRRRA